MAETLHGPYADLEMGSTSLYPSQPSDEIQLRWAFIRKIYWILTIELLFIIALISIVVFVRQVAQFLVLTPPRLARYRLALDYSALFVPLILIRPLDYYSQKYPMNYILFAAFTVFVNLRVGVICSMRTRKIILKSAILAAVKVTSLTLYTFWAAREGQDFSFLAPILVTRSKQLFFSTLIQIIIPLGRLRRLSRMIYGILAYISYSTAIVFDTDNLIKRFSYNQYIWAADALYLDIINLFVSLITLSHAFDPMSGF